ncbi:glycosyltransferase [Reichenbachiella sp. MALMAid0571]|uniref:glycosyltransferase n=1 Tax=Reichenbachiella sp. MALMAid0571 TaxID=3143939 RepID=UPI0032DFF450
MNQNKILFISHDASRTGAPIVLLNICKWLKSHTKFEFQFVLLQGGELFEEFTELASTHVLKQQSGIRRFFTFKKDVNHKLIKNLKKQNFNLIYFNTIASLKFLSKLGEDFPQPKIIHIHELSFAFDFFNGAELLQKEFSRFYKIIAVSKAVQEYLNLKLNIPEDEIELIHEPLVGLNTFNLTDPIDLRNILNLKNDAFIVGGSGTRDWRKGFDLFLQTALYTNREVHFVWIGGFSVGVELSKLNHELERFGVADRIHLIDSVENPIPYYKDFDLFYLCSREDPFPLVSLENAACGNPILCFENAGGASEIVLKGAGRVLPYSNLIEVAKAIEIYQNNPLLMEKEGEAARLIVKEYDIEIMMKKTLSLMQTSIKK